MPGADPVVRRWPGVLAAGALFGVVGPPMGMALIVGWTLVEAALTSTPKSAPGAGEMLTAAVLAYVGGGPPALLTGAFVGAAFPERRGRPGTATAAACAVGAVASSAWFLLLSGGSPPSGLPTVAAAGAGAAALCTLLRRVRLPPAAGRA